MAHRSFINEEGMIEVVFDGDMTPKGLSDSMGMVWRQCHDCLDRGALPDILMDFTDLGKVEPRRKQMSVSILKDLRFRKMAGFGARPLVRALTDTISSLAGTAKRTKNFKTRKEALKWLKA